MTFGKKIKSIAMRPRNYAILLAALVGVTFTSYNMGLFDFLHTAKLKAASSASQAVLVPTPDDLQRLSTQRAVIEKFISTDDTRTKYMTAPGKLGLLRAIIEHKPYRADQTYELQCMGIVLGDAFVEDMGMEWVIIEDEYGRDPALRMPNTSVIIYPLTMISKRVERGETVDVFEIYNGVASDVEELVARAHKK
jgi:hypothetical protein